MSQKVTVEIKNFKKIKELKEEFKSGNIYIVKGSNNEGKTSFIEAVNLLSNGKNDNKHILTHGEADGQLKGEFLLDGANNQRYIVKYDYNADKGQFTIIDPEANILKHSSKNDVLTPIFKYNTFTIEEFFGWGLTKEGQRKQADIVINLLPEKERKEYLDLEAKVNTKNGSLYFKRKSLNELFEKEKSLYDANKLSDEEIKLLGLKENVEALLKQLSDELSELEKSSINEDKLSKKIQFKQIIDFYDVNINSFKDTAKKEELTIDIEIQDLERKIIELRKKKDKLIDYTVNALSNLDNQYKEAVIGLKDINENSVDNTEAIKVLKERIDNGKNKKASIIALQEKETKAKGYQISLNKALDDKLKADEQLEKARERKFAIIEETGLPIDEVTIVDGELMYKDGNNLIPFIESSVSYSKGGRIVLKIMAELNKTLRIWTLGKAAEYDDECMMEFLDIVKKYDGILFLDRVMQEKTELEIECLEIN